MGQGKKERPVELIGRAVLVRDGYVLLCRSVEHGYSYLPGGHIDFGESASAAVRREFIEETGLPVHVGDLALVTEAVFESRGKRHHEINLVFHVEPSTESDTPVQWGGDGSSASPPPPVASLEPQLAFDWVELAAMPETDLRPPAIRAWLATLGSSRPSAATAEWVSEVPSNASTSADR